MTLRGSELDRSTLKTSDTFVSTFIMHFLWPPSFHKLDRSMMIMLLFFLIIGGTFRGSSALHLKGSWDNTDFFLFLTKFGFQKTDPKELQNTQGYIYGNITVSENTNSSHLEMLNHLTLVVVDSEYFLELFGNRTLEPVRACPAMFHKIDKIAFDYICQPGGKQDFLRKIPCPQGKLCIDEDGPQNVVPGYQFTYKVQDVQRPRFWYLSFVSCFRKTSDKSCEWRPNVNRDIKINYDIWLVNGNPSVKGLNPFEHQFSFEFHDVFEIHVIALTFCFLIFLLWLYVFNKQRHIITKIFSACLVGQLISITMNLIHVTIFAFNGVGAEPLATIGTLVDLATQCLFMLVLMLIAKGLGITTDHFKWKSVIFSLWAVYTVLNVFLYIWNLVEIDNIISNTNEWQTWPGYATLAFRVIVMFWFFYELRQTYKHTHRDELTFVSHFGAFFLVWFCYLPALALITTQVSPLWRYKTIISISYAVDILAYLVMVHLLWPTRSILFLVQGERPLPTYDLEITGLLDDMQETTLFNKAEIELERLPSQTDLGQTNITTDQPKEEENLTVHTKENGQANGFVLRNSHSNGNLSNGHVQSSHKETHGDKKEVVEESSQ